MTTPASTTHNLEEIPEEGYHDLERLLIQTFKDRTTGNPKLFTTDTENLFELFVAQLPEHRRGHYTCTACKRFMNRYGGLVTINEHGDVSTLWPMVDYVPPFFQDAVRTVIEKIRGAKITGVFLTKETTWGIPKNNDPKNARSWSHFHVVPQREYVFTERVKGVGEVIAEKTADLDILRRSLQEYPVEAAREAYKVLSTGNLNRSEKAEAIAKWFLEIHETIAAKPDKRRQQAILWHRVGTAPPGFCHVRSSMIGTLLDDIVANVPFETMKRKWNEKVHPLQYQRPQAPPTRGNIERAEKIVEKLGIAPSLRRRFAKLEDIQTIWRPSQPEPQAPKAGGVFGHLRAKDETVVREVEQPAVTMTWEKFRRSILPEATEIYAYAPSHGGYTALMTAADPTAPPIIQWDREDARNPVTWYVYMGGSYASQWNVSPGWVRVTGLAHAPNMWGKPEDAKDHHGRKLFVILEGARDTRAKSLALFPEFLKTELREVRATIEAHSHSIDPEGLDQASACGLMFADSGVKAEPVTLRVKTSLGTQSYRIDRWD